MKKILILFAAVIFSFGCLESRQHSIMRANRYLVEHPPEKTAHYWDNVAWTVVDGTTLTMDISAPESARPLPCVMIIHGGGWYMHNQTIMEGMARYLSNRGYAVFNINYRVLWDVKMEQIVEDALGALIWVKEHAPEYGGDPEKIAVTGDSAGGHLAAMIVTQGENPAFKPSYAGNGKTRPTVTCAAPTYGVYNFVSFGKIFPPVVNFFLGESCSKNPERCRLLSPQFHIRPGLPPQLVMVGDSDALYWQNRAYVKALRKAGNQAEFWIYPAKGHAFLDYYWNEDGIRGYDRMIEFLDQQFK